MKVGDYVRTIDDISKITDIKYNERVGNLVLTEDYNYIWYKEREIIKSSPDITDLLEPQDLMYIDIDNDYAGGIVVPRVAETMGELEQYIDRFKNKEITLVGIVTHEQLNNCMYKVVK